METKRVNVLGVKVDDIPMEEAVGWVKGWLSSAGKHYIVTPNPEFVVAALKDAEFKKILNQADLSLPDGVGLRLAGVKNTVAGTDLMERICQEAEDLGFTVGLLGGRQKVAKKAADCLIRKYPKLKIAFAEEGPEVDKEGKEVELGSKNQESRSSKLNSKFLILNSDILFVAFGQVKQEKWIYKHLDQLPIKIAMGVGGAFDYLSGQVLRAPTFIRRLGLEWLFRLLIQPWRVKRQIALLKFFYLVLH